MCVLLTLLTLLTLCGAREEEEHTINKKLYPILAVLLKVKTKKSQGLGFGEKKTNFCFFYML